MADVLVGSERRVLVTGYGLPVAAQPPPESLLGRLDQIDLRLRQLEEQRRPPAHAAATADDGAIRRAAPSAHHHAHTKSLPSALQHVQLRGTLMDRLNLLESRIRQLGCELDLDIGGGNALGLDTSSSSVPPHAEDRAWSESAPLLEPDPAPPMRAPDKAVAAPDGTWSAVEILQKGARQLHRNKTSAPNKVKNLKEAKCACQKEKRKAERIRTGRRWFSVGC